MHVVELGQSGANLADLIQQVTCGEPFVIALDGKAVAQVTPYAEAEMATPAEEQALPPRKLGALKGMYNIPDDFDTMFQKEIEEMFYGES